MTVRPGRQSESKIGYTQAPQQTLRCLKFTFTLNSGPTLSSVDFHLAFITDLVLYLLICTVC